MLKQFRFYPFHRIRKDKKFRRLVQMYESFTQFPELVVLTPESCNIKKAGIMRRIFHMIPAINAIYGLMLSCR